MYSVLPFKLTDLALIVIISSLILLTHGCDIFRKPGPEDVAQARALLEKSQNAFQSGDMGKARAMVDSAKIFAPDLSEVFFVEGLIYDRLDSLQQALQAYNTVLKKNPEYPGIQFNIGNVLYRQKQYEDAIRHYRRELTRFDSQQVPFLKSDLLVNLGLAYSHMGRSDSAKYVYRQAIQADSSYGDAYLLLAKELQGDGEVEGAVQLMQTAVAQSPQNLNYRYDLSSLQFRTGQLERALDNLNYILENRPWDYRAHYTLGQILLRQGNESEGEEHIALSDTLRERLSEIFTLQQEARDKPDNLMLWANLGRSLYEIGNTDAALKAMNRALALDSDNIAIRNNMAYMELTAGDTAAAIRQFRSILNQDSSLVQVWTNLALTLTNAGKLTEAQSAWNRVLELDPDNSTAKKYLR